MPFLQYNVTTLTTTSTATTTTIDLLYVGR